ncbi:MAG TPA: aldo/keto reductase [Bryobacteraceae bacterium]|jgi:aryl-alcohol dehydrogenase-like predicted oxidoreductase|nr:aldo/keto reductase [Bryobacteraceae bacterium]
MNATTHVYLATADRWTTRAGFGCSGLMGALGRRESLALLSAAWDAGIRHFDVAPLYGHGEAENVLGSFLRGKRDQATIVTKFGLAPTGNSWLLRIARAMARPLRGTATALRPRHQAATQVAPPRAPFDARHAERSLVSSLRALQTDCIDILLLHEAEPHLLGDNGLLNFLEQAVRKGMIRSFGVGGESGKASAVFSTMPLYCRVVQCEWNALNDRIPNYPGSDVIVFGAIGRCRDRGVPPEAVLRAAALALAGSVVLFSSRNAAHIASSARALTDARLDASALDLLAAAGNNQSAATQAAKP